MKQLWILLLLALNCALSSSQSAEGEGSYSIQVPNEISDLLPEAPPTVPEKQAREEDFRLYQKPQNTPSAAEQRGGQVLFGEPLYPQEPEVPPPPPPQKMEGMPYEFEWNINDVESNNVYSHSQNSDGSLTRGEYRVLLPNGKLQIVTFMDSGNGYQAQVSYQDYP